MYRRKKSKEEIKEIIKKHGINSLRLIFTDILGFAKTIEIPATQLDRVLNNKVMFDSSSIQGFSGIEESDMYLYPDLSSLIIFPLEEDNIKRKIAGLFCDIYTQDHVPFEGDPRGNLKRIIRKMESDGFSEFNLGPEPEFFLFRLNSEGKISKFPNDQGHYLDPDPIDLGYACRMEIVKELENIGFEIECSHHEAAPGQQEIDFKYTNALDACDNIQIFKLIVKKIARKHGLHATFMPKPLTGINGSGMHCNMSLFKKGKNTFFDMKSDMELSETALNFLGGLLKHSKAFTSICNPTINSYKRLVAGYEAPVYISWSESNRSALIRIPSSRGISTRLELRSVDPSANPYLAISVLLLSGLDGISKSILPISPTNKNIYLMSKEERKRSNILKLPSSLYDALEELKKDEIVKEALGLHIHKNFLKCKYQEWDSYKKDVSEWEKNHYFKQ